MERRRLALALVMTLACLAVAKVLVVGPSPMPTGPQPYVEAPNEQAGLDGLRELHQEQVEDDVEETD
jgi:hypothetical protein